VMGMLLPKLSLISESFIYPMQATSGEFNSGIGYSKFEHCFQWYFLTIITGQKTLNFSIVFASGDFAFGKQSFNCRKYYFNHRGSKRYAH